MGNKQTVLKSKGYTVVNQQEKMMLVKKDGDLFVVKKLRADQDDVSKFLLQLNHPHIVEHKEIIRDGDCLYLVLEHCEGGDLAQKIKRKMEKADPFSETEILDCIVEICMALQYLHDQQILHSNLQPKSIFFTARGTVRLGEFGEINERCTVQTAETEDLLYVAPEYLSGKPYDEKFDVWSLGCVIYEMCTLKCTFTEISTVKNILTCSYDTLPKTFSENLRQLVKDTLQIDPANRPYVNEILMRPFIIKHRYEKSTQTIGELYQTLDVLGSLADGLETVHFNTTVSSLTGGVVGLAGGITSLVGLILTPFTLGASLIVTGVGIGVSVAGGITAGVSNITKIVNQRIEHQKIKMIIKELQEKMTSTSYSIQLAVETEQIKCLESNELFYIPQFRDNKQPKVINGLIMVGRVGGGLAVGLDVISDLARLTKCATVGKVAAHTARAVRVATTIAGILSQLLIIIDMLFIVLNSKEIHELRHDYALRKSKKESENAEADNLSTDQKEQELRSEIMKFVKKIRDTTAELKTILDELNDGLQNLKPEIPNSDNKELSEGHLS